MEESDHRRPHKSDGDSEKSLDSDADDLNGSPNSSKDSPEEVTPTKAAEGSDYESAEEEEEKADIENYRETNLKEPESPTPELVDEEGGEEGIAENEDVEGDFLNGDLPENGSEEEDYVEEERQQGDGEECSPTNAAEKELDFDEDRRNPQYIPKKGMFYEHDDRNNEDNKEKEEEPTRDRKKKLWLDEGKWGHDRFCLEDQYPKSKNELIDTYGYDIRNEDGPPRARRRRRYGRGPTKYSRNWEDSTAYGREKFKTSPRGSPRGRRGAGRFRGGNPRFRGRGQLDFNSAELRNDNESSDLINGEEQFKENNEDVKAVDTPPVMNREEFPALPSKNDEPKVEEVSLSTQYFSKSPPKTVEAKSVRTLTFENSNYSGRNSAERDIPPRRGKTPFSGGNHDRGMRRPDSRGNRGSGRGDYNRRGRSSNNRHISPRFLENKTNNNLSNEMEYLSLNIAGNNNQICDEEQVPHIESNGELPLNANINDIQNMALKGAGDSGGRPKRYSSLRQRSLPETSTYPTPPPQQLPTQHPTYYETAGYQAPIYAPSETCVPTPSTQSQTATSAPIIAPTAYQTYTPSPYPDSYGLRMSVTPPPRLYPQASVAPPQPILAPATCIPPAPSILNFPPPPPTQFHQFAYQQYSTPPPPPPAPAPPSEIYQPGITYYYPPTQQPRQTIQKRVAKAIPIVPPPDKESSRKDKNDSSAPSNSNNHKYTDTTSEDDSVNISGVRTETSSQLQSTVGVES